MKKEIAKLNATPSKRIFYSIIADYDLNRSICELVDNGLDVWVRAKKVRPISINIRLNQVQQTITVEDDAGGLPRADLRYVVGPGETGTNPTDETIGIFGVGTKRAVVALAQDVKITTRFSKEKTSQIDFDDNWLKDDDWELPVYEVDEIPEGKTIVELQKLRSQVTDEGIAHLKEHLQTTYAKFLTGKGVTLKLNDESLSPLFFENWAYPPKYSPRRYSGILHSERGAVRVEALAGLSRESSPAAGEYGVYFYCNDRLVARALKTFDVGFTKGLAGLPHPKVSLTRVLVSLNGDARTMPWNSSKSDISAKHPVFLALHAWLVQVVKGYASLSRIWMGDWPNKVFKHTTGTIEEVHIGDFPTVTKSFLPPLPKSKPRYGDIITQKNKRIAKKKPWTTGLYEGVIAADLISKQPLEQKNRVALIVLDSTLEIAFKEYLVNESGTPYNDAKLLALFKNRHDVHLEIGKYVTIKSDTWKRIEYFYQLRNKLVHEKATVGINDAQIENFREVVESVLKKLFKLKFARS
jgi:hypothetical protein